MGVPDGKPVVGLARLKPPHTTSLTDQLALIEPLFDHAWMVDRGSRATIPPEDGRASGTADAAGGASEASSSSSGHPGHTGHTGEAGDPGAALASAAAAIQAIGDRELADERPAAETWEVELVGLHQVLSAVKHLMGVLGNGAPLYVVPAQWRDGSPPSLKDHPASELLTAGSEIMKAHDEFHDQLMLLNTARHRIGRVTLKHDQLSIWSKKP